MIIEGNRRIRGTRSGCLKSYVRTEYQGIAAVETVFDIKKYPVVVESLDP